MGLSAFWTAIKRPRVNDSSSRKHAEKSHQPRLRLQTDSPALATGDSSPHHLDAIYDTHHHILPSSSNNNNNNGPRRHPSSPPRIHSPTSKTPRRTGLWKSHSLSIKPQQTPDESQPTKNVEKRRSFWRSDSKATLRATTIPEHKTTRAPPVRAPEPVSSSSAASETRAIAYENAHLLAGASATATATTATPIKAKRSSLRLSLRRSMSGKSSRSRLSWLGGGAEDSDSDEDIPALPPIPVHLKRQASRSQDPGRHLGMTDGSYVLPGTAVTSDNLYSTHQPAPKDAKKRQSLTSIITKRKSSGTIRQLDQDASSNKRKRRSWFSINGQNDGSDITAIPPMPTLPPALNPDGTPVDPSAVAFHRFLHNVHNAHPQGATTDYERFLVASRAYDESLPSQPYLSHRNNVPDTRASLPVEPAAPTAMHPALKRATYSPQRDRRSRASHCRPQTAQSRGVQALPGRDLLSREQQQEWDTLRDLLNDTIKSASMPSSVEDDEDEDEDGYNTVVGMVRELKRDEELADQLMRNQKRGYGVWSNDEALARLEFGR